MKHRFGNGSCHGTAALSGSATEGFAPSSSDRSDARLRRALARAAELEQVLATRNREVEAAWYVVRNLREINSRLTEDLARLQQKEEQVRALAYHDELTGLPNRRLLWDRLHQALAHGMRHDKQVVLLLLDLDGFKTVNDRLGHGVGDKLLKVVAERLSACVRGADTACRYGGDEFIIMLPAVEHEGMATAVISKVQQRLAEPCRIDGFEIRIAASIGAVFYPADGQTSEELMGRADDALYRAKAARGGTPRIRMPRDTGAALEAP